MMLYYPETLMDQWILDDVNQGDLTTRVLGIGRKEGSITFFLKRPGRVSGVEAAEKVLRRLGLEITERTGDGTDVAAQSVLIGAAGKAEALHQAWKVVQNILEWSCGVAEYTAQMVYAVKQVNPAIQVAATRKNIPGTKLLALAAILNGGGIIHRGGTGESILLFADHRRFLDFAGTAEDWKGVIGHLRAGAPEKKIILEADTYCQAIAMLDAEPDSIQLDTCNPETVAQVVEARNRRSRTCMIAVAGGLTKDNAPVYAAAGAQLIVSSAPYYAAPADVQVLLKPL
ncbi:MAG: ModD protein [Treponema sp.]|jgi:molybdenum transport protein|nr:ModD protein [Treponema sp.]